jgi:hypothetical protein
MPTFRGDKERKLYGVDCVTLRKYSPSARGAFVDGLLVQEAVIGALERTQAVFDQGRLVAYHIYRQVAEGPSGGDVLKISVQRPEIRSLVERIGSALVWHGALSFD